MLNKIINFFIPKHKLEFKESLIIGVLPILFIYLVKILINLLNYFIPNLIKSDLELDIFINISFWVAFISLWIIFEKYKDFKYKSYLIFSWYLLFIAIIISIIQSASIYYDNEGIKISEPEPRISSNDMDFIIRNIEKYCNKNSTWN